MSRSLFVPLGVLAALLLLAPAAQAGNLHARGAALEAARVTRVRGFSTIYNVTEPISARQAVAPRATRGLRYTDICDSSPIQTSAGYARRLKGNSQTLNGDSGVRNGCTYNLNRRNFDLQGRNLRFGD